MQTILIVLEQYSRAMVQYPTKNLVPTITKVCFL